MHRNHLAAWNFWLTRAAHVEAERFARGDSLQFTVSVASRNSQNSLRPDHFYRNYFFRAAGDRLVSFRGIRILVHLLSPWAGDAALSAKCSTGRAGHPDVAPRPSESP